MTTDRPRPTGVDPAGTPLDRGALVAVRATDEVAWAAVLAETVQHDFHHLAGYHRVAEHRGEGTAFLFAYREDRFRIALPLLLRPVDPADPTGIQDATSVYGYCGPVASHERIPAPVVTHFHEALERELVGRRVVTAFSRLHPLIAQRDLLAGLGEVGDVGLTVSVDLTLPAEEQWGGYAKKCRRIIRRTRDAGVICVHDRERAYRREWVRIYGETMRRVHAPRYYEFDADYFEQLAAELGDVLHLFIALLDGNVVAGGLFTLCDGIVQAHLGATADAYLKLSPTRLVDDTARRWAHESGARVFHLGGGVAGREDSLFRYKASFSDRRHEFAIWRWVIDEAAYEELCARQARPGDHGAGTSETGYFPAYRRPNETAGPGA
jgi:hypothetical protein